MKKHSFTKSTLPYSIPICLECRTVFELLNIKINYKNELSLHYKCQCPFIKYVNFDSYYYGLNLLKSLERNKCSDNVWSYCYCLDCKTYVSSSNEKVHSSHFLSDYYIKDYYLMCSFHQSKKLLYCCKTCETYICSFCKNTTHKKHQINIITNYDINIINDKIKESLIKLQNNLQIVKQINILKDLYFKALNSNESYTHYYLLTSLINLTKIEYTTSKIRFIQNNRLKYIECNSAVIFPKETVPFPFSKIYVEKVIPLQNETILLYILFKKSEICEKEKFDKYIDSINIYSTYGKNKIKHELMDPQYKEDSKEFQKTNKEKIDNNCFIYVLFHVDKYFQKELSIITFYQQQYITKYENNIYICADNTRLIFYDFTDTAKAVRYIINNHNFSINRLMCRPVTTTLIGIDYKETLFYFNQTEYCSVTFKKGIYNIFLYKEDKVLLLLYDQVMIYSLKDKKQVHSFVPYDGVNIHCCIEKCALSNDYHYFIMEGYYQEDDKEEEKEEEEIEDETFCFFSIYDLENKKMIRQKKSYSRQDNTYFFSNIDNMEKLIKSGELFKEHTFQISVKSYYNFARSQSIKLQYGYNISISNFYNIFLYRGWIKNEYV